MEKQQSPELRFSQFKNDWNETILGNLSQIRRGASPRPIEDPKWFDSDGVFGWLRIADVTQQNGRIFNIEQKLSAEGQKKTLILEEPHLILSIAATVGKPVINYVPTGIHDGFIVFLNLNADREFIFQWLERFRPNWFKLGQPGSQLNLNSELVKNQSIFLSSLMEEQTQIGNFFQNLDQSISLHEKKLAQTQNLKKAMMEKMFPKEGGLQPEIRLKGFSGDWEQRKLGDISEVKTGPFGSTLHADDYVNNGTPIVTTEHFKSGELPKQKKGIPQVSELDLCRLNNYVLKTDDIVFSRVGSVDINALVTPFQAGWLFSGRVLRVRSYDYVWSSFLHYELSTERAKNDVISRAVGQTMPSINTEILKRTKVYLPKSKVEQIQIGQFFKQLDETLVLQQQQLQTLKNLKQAFLEKMFV